MVASRILLTALLYGAAVLAAPAIERRTNDVKMMSLATDTKPAGALYCTYQRHVTPRPELTERFLKS